MAHAWRALRHRNFRMFFVGQSISVMGTWMTRLATSWLVYQLSHSALMLGAVSFSGQIVSFLLGPFAGVWVERLDRRRLLVWTQAAATAQSMALAALTLGHWITIWEVVALTMVQGVINSLDTPGRQSFLAQMVGNRDDLSNAIAINSSMANGARLLGPAVAGGVVAMVGEGWCFLLDGFSYFAVIASLLAMQLPAVPPRTKAHDMLAEIREGWDYVRGFQPIRVLLLHFAWVSMLGYSYTTVLPLFAGEVLHGGPSTLGWLMGASGLGALGAAISLVVRKSVLGLTRMVQIASVALGLALVLLGWSHALWLSLGAMGLIGFGLIQCASASNTIIQSLVPEDKRARVMSYYTMAFYGASPFGSLLAGGLAQSLGAPAAVVLTGLGCLAGAAWFSVQLPGLTAAMRPVYQQLGILPGDTANLLPLEQRPTQAP